MYMVSVIKKLTPLLLCSKIFLIALFGAWPDLCQAGVENTKHDLFPHDKERNCNLCHSPHSDKSQPALWISEEKPSIGDKTIFFTPAIEEKVLCLSCHDGIFAKDICAISATEVEEPGISVENIYYRGGGTLFFSTCEKHYNLVSYYRSQFPQQQLKCTTCHDVHFKVGTRKNGLISSKVYFKHKICLICHQAE